MAPRLALVAADDVVVGEPLVLADADTAVLDAAGELDDAAVDFDVDTPTEGVGTAAVPPTLAQDVSTAVSTAIQATDIAAGERRRRAGVRRLRPMVSRPVARPCDMASFCQPD